MDLTRTTQPEEGDVAETDEILGHVAMEFFERRAAGQQPTIEEYAQKYPQIAEHIRRTFPALELVGKSPARERVATDPCAEQTLGDFHIISELGRGGMGVVYEAEQISVGRRVALKVLPFATLADDRVLKRFKNEVRAAASLDHPNIVTVLSFGEQKGIHYYAMQLIRGQSLDEVISSVKAARRRTANEGHAKDLRSSSGSEPETKPMAAVTTSIPVESGNDFYRRVAELGIQSADALQHAHGQGVIHRDIKPANLMLDTAGRLYVTDFGLARIEADVGLTMTGDLVGTLRYMAPEQALAKRVLVDQRADLYSLGATLYELTTLSPVFRGQDREQLLKQVTFEQPIAPSVHARDIPRDLETIILKCLSKDPDDRYSSAEALSADLDRFLELKPIHARRPTPLQIATKWVRRNPWASMGTVALLCVAVVSLALGFASASNEAEKQRRMAYSGTLALAFDHHAAGRYSDVRRLLDQTMPTLGQQDLRGCEWYILDQIQKNIAAAPQLTFASRIHSLAYSNDGKQLAVLTKRGGLSVVDLDERLHRRMVVSDGPFVTNRDSSNCVAFSPDGRYLFAALGKGDHGLRRFDLHSGPVTQEFFDDQHAPPECSTLCVSSDGMIATSANGESAQAGTIAIWDFAKQPPHRSRVLAEDDAYALAFSPDGKQLASAAWYRAVVWDVASGRELKRWDFKPGSFASRYNTVDYSPDGSLLAVSGAKFTKVWDVANGFVELWTASHEKWVNELEFLGDGQYLATASSGGDVDILEARSGKRVLRHKSDFPVRAIAYSPVRDEIAIGSADGTVTLRRAHVPGVPNMVMAYGQKAAAHTASTNIALVDNDRDLHLWKSHADHPAIANVAVSTKRDPQKWAVRDYTQSPDGKRIAVLETRHVFEGVVTLWDDTGTLLHQIECNTSRVEFTADGASLVTFDIDDGQLKVWDWSTGKQIVAARSPQDLSSMTAIDTFGRGQESLIVTGHGQAGVDGNICIWKYGGSELQPYGPPIKTFDVVEDVGFTPDGQSVIAGDVKGATIYEMSSGQIRELATGDVLSLDVSPDGQRLVTVGSGIIRFWNLKTGKPLGEMDFGRLISCVRFLNEKQILYIVDGGGARVLGRRDVVQ